MCWFWFIRKQKIVRQIGSCDSESELENSKDSQGSKEIAHKEDNRTSKASRPKVITENEYTDSRPSKWGFSSHQSSKKIYPKASQKVYVPLKIWGCFIHELSNNQASLTYFPKLLSTSSGDLPSFCMTSSLTCCFQFDLDIPLGCFSFRFLFKNLCSVYTHEICTDWSCWYSVLWILHAVLFDKYKIRKLNFTSNAHQHNFKSN